MSKRIYVVEGPQTAGLPAAAVVERMVNATTQSAALSFVAKAEYAVKIARPADVARLMGAGVKVEETEDVPA